MQQCCKNVHFTLNLQPMRKFIALLFGLMIIGWLASCEEEADNDVQNPDIQILQTDPLPTPTLICGNEEEAFQLTGGDLFPIELKITDNEALSEFKLDIHSNFDCHGHGTNSGLNIAPPEVASATENWSVLDIQNLQGTEAILDLDLQLPNNITAGSYHFSLQALDLSGNESTLLIYDILAFHPDDKDPPTLAVNLPAGNSWTANRGSTITFTGTLTDNRQLSQGGNGVLFLTYTDENGNTSVADFITMEDMNQTTYDFNWEYTIPSSLTSGSYTFSLRARDGVNNAAIPHNWEVVLN